MLHAEIQQFHLIPGLDACLRALEDNEHRAIVGVGPALTAALAQWLRVR